jgi:hypothetical protein
MRPLQLPEPRQVPAGKCRGVKRDGDPCTFAAKGDGLCTRHQGQDPDAVVPVRVQQVAAELTEALGNVPEPLRIGPAADVAPQYSLEDMAGILEPIPSTAVDEAVDDPITWCDCREGEECPPGQLCRRRSHLPDPRQPATVVEPLEPGELTEWAGRMVKQMPRELNGNPTPHSSMATPEDAAQASANAELALMDQVRACRTSGELAMLYEATGSAWTAAVKSYASRHRELLPELGQQERASAALVTAISAASSQAELTLLFTDPRNAELITPEHKAAAKRRAAELPPF